MSAPIRSTEIWSRDFSRRPRRVAQVAPGMVLWCLLAASAVAVVGAALLRTGLPAS